ncbi:1-phosphofructokinase family hexose kinase [Homoserinimonas sp. A520]
MTEVVIFAPSPVLTVTVEDQADGPDLHLHAGGQGVWQARMLLRMGVDVAMCCVLSGESGRVLRHLLADEGIRVVAVERDARSGAYVHDRRGGERVSIVEIDGDPISRHDFDELYGVTLREGLDAGLVILSGPAGDDTVPADVYRRLAADLRAGKPQVVVDLSGERLTAALAGGVTVAKVSDEELLADGRIKENTTERILAAIHAIAEQGAESVIITRADKPILMLADGVVSEVITPTLEVADTKGAGDSLTAGVSAALANGAIMLDAITLGAAAGALNVTRHGLGTGDPEAIEKLRALVSVRRYGESEASASLTPDELAARAEEE